MMKGKSGKTVAVIVFAVLFFVAACVFSVVIFTRKDEPVVNDADLFGSYKIYRSSSTNCRLYDINEKDESVFEGWIYKYAFDSDKKVIAFHGIVGDYSESYNASTADAVYYRYHQTKLCAVKEDSMVLYDCESESFTYFESEAELAAYCAEKGIKLGAWTYPTEKGFDREERTPLAGDYCLVDKFDGYSSIMCGEKEIFFGYITDARAEGDKIIFRLRQTDAEYSPEQPDANKGLLPINQSPVGKYKCGFLEFKDIYYDQIITLDVNTGEFAES